MDAYQAAKEEIRKAADITELIGQYVQLKKAGRNFLGLCPFHSEKTPSFTVSPAKQMFHCFGCKVGGDIFRFWMEYHKVSFPQAVRDLAEKYHIILPERKLTPAQKQIMDSKEILVKINESAVEYYHHMLLESAKGRAGREYLDRRSISSDVVGRFKIGFASADWDGLTRFFVKKHVDLDKAVQAGLLIAKKNGGYYDRFRGRIIFPIFDLRNRIVGLGGRVLDDTLPKYLNTPETPIFHKGELLYGLQAAYPTIRENGRVVIVEGYTDVLALHKHGFYEAVATLGTALTVDHIRHLKGYTNEAVVVFDSDTAGKGGAIKSLPLFQNEGLSARVMVLPEGDDPDSFTNTRGLDEFLIRLEKAVPLFDFYLDQKVAQIHQGVEGQVDFLKEILPVVSEINSSSHRALYTRRLAEKTGIAEAVVMTELESITSSHSRGQETDRLRMKISESKAKGLDDLHILNLIIHFPHTVGRLMDNDCRRLLSDPLIKEIFDLICETYKQAGRMVPEEVLENTGIDAVRERFREILLLPPYYSTEGVEQAVEEFIEKAHKVKLSESFRKAKDNLEESYQLLLLKRERLGLNRNRNGIFQEEV
ncbi:MAG: DNA primase [Deltaproteobacteria bacterium]|nr:DNA primase [Deltaproteobacteria bacterium]